MYIIVKEPFYKEANDLIPIIRVENPKDCIFDAKRLFQNQAPTKTGNKEQKKRMSKM